MRNELSSSAKQALDVVDAVGDAVISARMIAFNDPVGPPSDFATVVTQDDLILLLLGGKELVRCKLETPTNKEFMVCLMRALASVSHHMRPDGATNAWSSK